MDGWLDHPRGLPVARIVRVATNAPEVSPWEVPAEVGIVDDLGQKAVFPLALEEVPKLLHGAILGVVGVTDGDKGRVPGPLVWIEAWTGPGVLTGIQLRVLTWAWLGVPTGPVEVEDLLGLLNEVCIIL